MIRLIDPVTFVVPGTAGAHAPVVVEKFGAELRRAPAQFHPWATVNMTVGKKAKKMLPRIIRTPVLRLILGEKKCGLYAVKDDTL